MQHEFELVEIIARSDLVFIGQAGRRSEDFAYYGCWREQGQRRITFKRFDGKTETYDPRKTRVLIARVYASPQLSTNQSRVSKYIFSEGNWTNRIR